MKSKNKKRGEIAIYKPNGKMTGGVVQFKLSNNDDCMFLEAAKQVRPMKDPRPYDWETKIIVKLGSGDICKFLAYLNMPAPSAPLKLFHQSPNGGNKTVEFKYQEYNGKPGYFLSVSAQGVDKQTGKAAISIGLDEAEFLKVGFKKALEVFLSWDQPEESWDRGQED